VKLVLVSQRVDFLAERGERRDALDQRLANFLAECGLLPIPVPNRREDVRKYFDELPQAAGVVLSGGNDLNDYGGDAPERDRTEARMQQEAMSRGMPVVGICRGMQFLIHADGGELCLVDGHVGAMHPVLGDGVKRSVNSFHRWGVKACPRGWEVAAVAQDGSVEYARRRDASLWGVMWHPERESVFAIEDIALFKDVFSVTA